MKKIPLGNGEFALVDDSDFDWLSKYTWHRETRELCKYATRNRLKGETAFSKFMHRLIMDAPPKTRIDHINGNGLDNRRSNLRFCDHSQNLCNRRLNKNSATGLKGVHFNQNLRKWTVSICKNNHQFRVGTYSTSHDAMIAYDAAATVLHKQFARTNAML